jgi:hypothetical protein
MFLSWTDTSMARAPKTTRKGKRRKQHRVRPYLEQLEARNAPGSFRSFDGGGNNVLHPEWGESGTDLLRVEPTVHYADGISSPSNFTTVSARVASNNLNNQSSVLFSFLDDLGPNNQSSLSDYSYLWGQFIDHDMDLTLDNSGQAFNIAADTRMFPNGMGGTQPDPMGKEDFTRSKFDPNTGTSTANPRQQVNESTSYLDLSQVYGSTQFVADALRTGSGGHLKSSPGNLLPFNNTTYFTQAQLTALNMANDAHQVPDANLFAAGDRRANENIELTAVQTLFMRNHNRIADQLAASNPADFGFTSWTDTNLYQEARKLNIAEEEIITYQGYLPSLFGANFLPTYAGYKSGVNASISTEFSTVGFRFGHSLLSNAVGRNNNDGTDITDVSANGAAVNLIEDFFRPDLINPNGVTVNLLDRNAQSDPHTSSGIGAILKADADNLANEFDLRLIDEIRSGLFSIPIAPGTDLAARDVQRARDHGIGSYNDVRVAFGLSAVTSFDQITKDGAVQTALKDTYGTVDKIDPFEGMLAEDHVNGTDFGVTVRAILAKQFANLRDGDRFFYLNENFTTAELNIIGQGNTLAKVIQNNTSITNLQSNVFFFKDSITGTVADDGIGVSNVLVQLRDSTGAVIATTKTNANGFYSFTELTGIPGTGRFSVTVVKPGFRVESAASLAVAITRGDLDFDNFNFEITDDI